MPLIGPEAQPEITGVERSGTPGKTRPRVRAPAGAAEIPIVHQIFEFCPQGNVGQTTYAIHPTTGAPGRKNLHSDFQVHTSP
jgi:hypothetical protein